MKITASGLTEAIAYIKQLPRGVKVAGMRALVTYIIGDSSHGLRHEPSYKYVTRARAYGQTFQSDKQRRWFWANGGPDMIGDNRTHAIQNGWRMQDSGDWSQVRITNNAPGIGWVMGDSQAAQPALVGWRVWSEVVKSNMAGAMQAARRAVDAVIQSRGRL